jgi:lipoprotein-releasing system ATP-binding protein
MAQPGAPLILEGIVKHYSSGGTIQTVLSGITLEVQPGETVAIVGPSGAGKSTLLNIVGALDRPSSGRVRLANLEVSSLAGSALAGFRATQVGFVFQEHHLLPQLTAEENVLLPALATGQAAAASARAKELLQRMGVAHRAQAFPAQMSGGERQRVAVARALINGARLLLCDEPTGSLDVAGADAVVSLLLELAAGDGVTVLMVTHNLEQAQRFGLCLELRNGQLQVLAGGTV